VGGVFWDLEKLFDTVPVGKLCLLAHALQFPLSDLLMSLQVHYLPRVIVYQRVVGPVLLPRRSILAGCAFSIPFVRALLRMAVVNVVRSVPLICTQTYVDDMAQVGAHANQHQLAENLALAATVLARRVGHLQLLISAKSTIVTQPRWTARYVKHALRDEESVNVSVATHVRDLWGYFCTRVPKALGTESQARQQFWYPHEENWQPGQSYKESTRISSHRCYSAVLLGRRSAWFPTLPVG
jgi:hypothetical protein